MNFSFLFNKGGSKATADQILQLVFDIEERNISEDVAGNMSSNPRDVAIALTVTSSDKDKPGNKLSIKDESTTQESVTSFHNNHNDDQILKEINTHEIKGV